MRINPNSSIRSGYSYEDLYVLKLCVDWLRDPERYSEIKIQFVPENLGIKGFALDDVTASRRNGIERCLLMERGQILQRLIFYTLLNNLQLRIPKALLMKLFLQQNNLEF